MQEIFYLKVDSGKAYQIGQNDDRGRNKLYFFFLH